MDKVVVDPLRIYEVNGQVCPLLCAAFELTAGNNQQIVAATSGKRVRVMGWIAQAAGAAVAGYRFKSNSGGTTIMPILRAPMSTNGDLHTIEIVDSGRCETSTGHGLYADAGADMSLCVFYIVYTPT